MLLLLKVCFKLNIYGFNAHYLFMAEFDPEEDAPAQESGSDDSGDSDDGLAGTEHYGEVRYVINYLHFRIRFNIIHSKSKLRQDEVGPQYAGSRISREALFNDDNEDSSEPDDEEEEEKEEKGGVDVGEKFADPKDIDIDMDEDGDIDSDAAFGESDAEKFKDFTFRGSSTPITNGASRRRPTAADFMTDSDDEEAAVNGEKLEDETDEDILDVDEQHPEEPGVDSEGSAEEGSDKDGESPPSEGDESDKSDEKDENDESDEESESGSEDGDDEKARRAELREIMNEEQTTVAAILQAASADADKGNAVRQQRKTFDSLLNVRVVLQKALIATNSMATVEENNAEDAGNEPYEAAEDAALKLWNTLDRIRHELIKANGTAQTGQKRKRGIDSSTPSSTIWERMQDSEVASIDNRQRILEKWWGKVKGSTPATGKLISAAPTQSITAAIQDQLSKPRVLENIRRPRSCAPIQEKLKVTEDPQIYDDSSFYKLLLNQLVEQRKMEAGPAMGGTSIAPAQWAVKEAKMRKNVDTKASKGRKIRYTVHEKLQNFMAPENRGNWEQEAIDRFFGTLLGQKMTLGEEDMEVDGEENGVSLEEAGLRLFRS
jgi:protein AATF/BFR2